VKRAGPLAALALAAAGACARAPTSAREPSAASPPPAPPPAAAPAPPPEEDLVAEAPESDPTSETVTIKLVAPEARKARVFWGRKDLGFAPLELQRPRGSGPLDLLVVAPGALPLHTRVFTDRDDKLALRLYAEAEGPSLLGYREPVDPPAKIASGGATAKRKIAPRP
jgi:hypothetical protein